MHEIKIGQRFGMCVVVAEVKRTRFGERRWRLRCDCGVEQDTAQTKVPHKRSCGCTRSPRVHGFGGRRRRPPEYGVWKSMRSRCNSKGRKDYERYGGRGIRVDPAFDDFAFFFAHVGPRPTPKHQLDRIDNAGHYAPGNVRWATAKEQAANRRARRDVLFTKK